MVGFGLYSFGYPWFKHYIKCNIFSTNWIHWTSFCVLYSPLIFYTIRYKGLGVPGLMCNETKSKAKDKHNFGAQVLPKVFCFPENLILLIICQEIWNVSQKVLS